MRRFIVYLFLCSLQPAWATVYPFGILGDAGVWNDSTKRIQASMKNGAGPLKDLILPGDNLYDVKGNYFDVWKNWIGFSLQIVAVGNHHIGYEKEIAFFRMPGEYFTKVYGGDLRFIVLNSDNEKTVKEQESFFAETIKKAKEQFVVVVFHHPPYTVSERHSWKEKKAFHQAIRPLIWKHRDQIDLVIAGHDHIASIIELDDLPLVVSGSSFESLPAPRLNYVSSDGVRVRTGWRYNGKPHWTRLDFDTEENHVWVNFVDPTRRGVPCSVRLFEKKLFYKKNCAQRHRTP